jgi:hypothetical protein
MAASRLRACLHALAITARIDNSDFSPPTFSTTRISFKLPSFQGIFLAERMIDIQVAAMQGRLTDSESERTQALAP